MATPLKPRLTIRETNYTTAESVLREIRFRVFVDEQGVPAEIEMDDRDAHCIHLLALVGASPVATARIDLAKSGKIGRLAVLPEWRGAGVGRALMQRCHEIAAAHDLGSVWCNAQIGAVPFYERLGYEITGPLFVEAGIDHFRMEKVLTPNQLNR